MTEGIFKMNDSERLTLLKECKRDARMVLSNERMLHEKYMNVANIRMVNKAFRNKENN